MRSPSTPSRNGGLLLGGRRKEEGGEGRGEGLVIRGRKGEKRERRGKRIPGKVKVSIE